MLFFQPAFLFGFLPVVWIGFVVLHRFAGQRPLSGWLLISSWVFYAWSYPWHLLLLLGSISVNWFFARRIAAAAGRSPKTRWLSTGIVLNLALLGYYKYLGFLLGSAHLLPGFASRLAEQTLPLAISFFTFQQITFLVLAFRSGLRETSLAHYALYVSFFPQLIAGPIVRAEELVPQLRTKAFGTIGGADFWMGFTLFCIGLGKKLLLADPLARIADPIFARLRDAGGVSALEAWMALLAFGLQIYFDFSAYSEMAQGLGRMFGLRLPENFASPYQARSLIEFWHRWHITLSTFFRDFVYIPLGGSRRGEPLKHLNLLVTMAIAGLWHGANWTFLCWGVAHGLLLSVNHVWRRIGLRLPGVIGSLLTFVTVMLAWVLFRADNLHSAGRAYAALFGRTTWLPGGLSLHDYLQGLQHAPQWASVFYALSELHWLPAPIDGVQPGLVFFSEPVQQGLLLVVALALTLILPRPLTWLTAGPTAEARLPLRGAILAAALVVLIVVSSATFQPTTFIYFRF